MTTVTAAPPAARQEPTEALLTIALVVAPVLYLVVDSLYATRGWDDADAGGLHVVGAILYGFALLRVTSWSTGWLGAAALVTAVVGAVGNAAYGFNTIQVSMGSVDLVDTSGPGAIIKPLGLFFPLALLVSALVVHRTGARVAALLLAVAGVAWPVAHIGNIGWLAVVVNVGLVVALVPLGVVRRARRRHVA